MPKPFKNNEWIIDEIRKQVANNTIKKLKKGKIDVKEILLFGLTESLYSNLKPKKPKRKNFSNSTKREARQRQKDKCNDCRKKTDVWEYDHFNGDRTDNSLNNCQALCPICHARKTRKIPPKKRKFFP